MKIVLIILGLAIMVALLVSIYNLWNNHYVYSQFKTFNENIKNWSIELDNNTRDAINRQAMYILGQIDTKISEGEEDNNNDNNLDEDGNDRD